MARRTVPRRRVMRWARARKIARKGYPRLGKARKKKIAGRIVWGPRKKNPCR